MTRFVMMMIGYRHCKDLIELDNKSSNSDIPGLINDPRFWSWPESRISYKSGYSKDRTRWSSLGSVSNGIETQATFIGSRQI